MEQKEIIILNEINITSLFKAANKFKQGIATANTELAKDGVILRFKYTYELVWKTLKRILKFKGLYVYTPRDTFREAAKQELIEDPLVWFEFIKLKHMTTEEYDSHTTEIFNNLPQFEKELDQLLNNLTKLHSKKYL